MPSRKRKIQGYAEVDVSNRFDQWKANRGITSDSIALNLILREYFGLEDKPEIAQEIETKLIREELKEEILAEVAQQIEPIKAAIGEIIAQFQQEKESPQLGLNQEAMETVWMQQEVIQQLQTEIQSLRESPSDIPFNIPSRGNGIKPEAKEITEEDTLEYAPMAKISEIKIPFECKPEVQGEQDLMNAIYEQNPTLDVEEAEEIYRLLVKGDSLQSLGESPIEEKLSAKDLAKRLRTSVHTLRRERNNSSFAVWAQKRDAFGLLWSYDAGQKVYVGIKPGEV